MNKPLFSLAILCYNNFDKIFEAIDSVLVQDYENYELIIHDNCSEVFASEELINYINQKRYDYSNLVRVIIKEEKAPYNLITRMTNIAKMAKGESIFFMPANSTLASKKVISRLADKANACKIIFSQLALCNSKKRITNSNYFNDSDISAIKENTTAIYSTLINKDLSFPYGAMIKKDCFKELEDKDTLGSPTILFINNHINSKSNITFENTVSLNIDETFKCNIKRSKDIFLSYNDKVSTADFLKNKIIPSINKETNTNEISELISILKNLEGQAIQLKSDFDKTKKAEIDSLNSNVAWKPTVIPEYRKTLMKRKIKENAKTMIQKYLSLKSVIAVFILSLLTLMTGSLLLIIDRAVIFDITGYAFIILGYLVLIVDAILFVGALLLKLRQLNRIKKGR